MRIRADEHVSLHVVRIVCEIALSRGSDFSSVFGAGHRGTSDEYWATQFAKDGGDAILTADTDFFSKPNQVVCIDRTGLKVIHLPSGWARARAHLQAAHILMWWPRIETTLERAKPRDVWTVPWNVNESGELKRRKVDFGAAHKKDKKAARRGN